MRNASQLCLSRGWLVAILAFFDFAAAFPSIIHKWLFLTLVAGGLPAEICNFFRALYTLNAALDTMGNFMLWYLSGVLQGCPGSAFVFNVSLDPFLCAFSEVLGERTRGILWACADDIGVALRDFRYLALLWPIFERAEKLAGLTLGPSKCHLAPTSEPWSQDVAGGCAA